MAADGEGGKTHLAAPWGVANPAANLQVNVGFHTELGQREDQQDVGVFLPSCTLGGRSGCAALLFDGHGGTEAAVFAAKELAARLTAPDGGDTSSPLSVAAVADQLDGWLREIDEEFCSWARSSQSTAGTTVLIALILGMDLYVANIGDTRCVIGRHPARGGRDRSPRRASAGLCIHSERLSFDHRTTEKGEKLRILSAGGVMRNLRVTYPGCQFSLNLTRCLGDVQLKDAHAGLRAAEGAHLPELPPSKRRWQQNQTHVCAPAAAATPQSAPAEGARQPAGRRSELITVTPHVRHCELTPDDSFLILASDGVFDNVGEDKDAVSLVHQHMSEPAAAGDAGGIMTVAAACARALVTSSVRDDNATAQVIVLKWKSGG